jgi:hypothetical protein
LIYDKINELDERVKAIEIALPEVKNSINEIDHLIKSLTRTNKELLYILSKAQLQDRDNKE